MSQYSVSFSVYSDAKSPFWLAQLVRPDGSRVKRSTKVPVEGGLFQGERLSKPQAKRRALLVAQELAASAQVEAQRQDNLSVRELFDTVLKGKLGRLSVATYANARTTYAQFCGWLGARRAASPARLVTRADIKQWVTDRRCEVRCKTVMHGLYVLRAASGGYPLAALGAPGGVYDYGEDCPQDAAAYAGWVL